MKTRFRGLNTNDDAKEQLTIRTRSKWASNIVPLHLDFDRQMKTLFDFIVVVTHEHMKLLPPTIQIVIQQIWKFILQRPFWTANFYKHRQQTEERSYPFLASTGNSGSWYEVWMSSSFHFVHRWWLMNEWFQNKLFTSLIPIVQFINVRINKFNLRFSLLPIHCKNSLYCCELVLIYE